jgi:hypothetical protein
MKNTIGSFKASCLFNPPYAFHPYCGNAKYAVSYLNSTGFQPHKGPFTCFSDLRTGISKKYRVVDVFVGYNFIKEMWD